MWDSTTQRLRVNLREGGRVASLTIDVVAHSDLAYPPTSWAETARTELDHARNAPAPTLPFPKPRLR